MHLFAGAGGGLLADLILGHKPIIAVEWDKYGCRVLRERVAEGWFPDLRVWEGDVRLFDPSEYEGRVSCVHAGFPCQDISGAGAQAGIAEGTRSGLYREVLRIADVVRPRYLFLENVSAILKKEWLQTVLQDLAALGYDARWTCLPASAAGAPHYRDRWWCLAERSDANCERKLQPEGCESEQRGWTGDVGEDVAYASSEGLQTGGRSRLEKSNAETGPRMEHESKRCCTDVADTLFLSIEGKQSGIADAQEWEGQEQRPAGSCGDGNGRRSTQSGLGGMADELASGLDAGWWEVEPEVGRIATSIPNRAARIKALGNGQVPIQAALAWVMLGGPI